MKFRHQAPEFHGMVLGVLDRVREWMRNDAPTLREISGPIAEAFQNSGMTEDELGELLEEAEHDMRRAREGK
jgi:hypothetical protein